MQVPALLDAGCTSFVWAVCTSYHNYSVQYVHVKVSCTPTSCTTPQRTSFVWGGCMLLRAAALQPRDPHGLLRAWGGGGYSDDLVLAAKVTEQQLAIAVPSFALFPQWCDPQWGSPFVSLLLRGLSYNI